MPFHTHVFINKEIWLCYLLPMSINNCLQPSQHTKQKLASWGKRIKSCFPALSVQLLQRLIQSVVLLVTASVDEALWFLSFVLSLRFSFLPWSHCGLSQPAAHPAPGAGSACALPCSVLHALHPSATRKKHYMRKAWTLNSTSWGGARRCGGGGFGGYASAKLFAPTSLPLLFLSFPYSSTSYTMEILCRWLKTTKPDRRCNFCTLKHDVMS